ncbi:solute carrier family 35 member G1 [Orussus abietinus]|uniref:solute carrier family 35 member G1 n=1 Tax=Orussus abietinus TaxID=222816 RepID=UPI000626358F|nr:solute carrier family 35 member G1 [Orussus abietinus]
MESEILASLSYGSIPSTYRYVERFDNNSEVYRDKTNWFGIFLAFLSGTFFTLSSALVKAIKNVDPMILLAIRALLQMVVMLIVVCKRSEHVFGLKEHRMLIHFQGLVGGMTLALLYYSFRKLPLGDATAIIFSSPVVVIILSFLFLREPCGILRVLVICTLLAGVIFVSEPPFLLQIHKAESYDVMGYVCAILATLFTAVNIVAMRRCLHVDYAVIVLNLSMWTFVTAVLFYFTVSEKHRFNIQLLADYYTWIKVVLVAITGLTGQVLVAKSLKIESAGKVAVTRSLDIVLAYIVQICLFHEFPSYSNTLGAMLILFSVLCMGFERQIYRCCDFIP